MKKKLLITMGCSLTEGVGCYDINTIPKELLNSDKNSYKISDFMEIYDLNLPRFHELGWPNHVGKKLGYDKVINLGFGGSSTSSQVKLFFEKYPTETFDAWEVLIIFMLPDPARFSFYINNKIKSYVPTNRNESIAVDYLKSINNIKYDTSLEQIFYIKLMEEVCKNRNFNFIYFNHSHLINEFISKLYPNENQLMGSKSYEGPGDDWDHSIEFYSPVCNHPNEHGYAAISNYICDDIYNQFPQYVGNPKDEIEWEWNGESIDHSDIIDAIERII